MKSQLAKQIKQNLFKNQSFLYYILSRNLSLFNKYNNDNVKHIYKVRNNEKDQKKKIEVDEEREFISADGAKTKSIFKEREEKGDNFYNYSYVKTWSSSSEIGYEKEKEKEKLGKNKEKSNDNTKSSLSLTEDIEYIDKREKIIKEDGKKRKIVSITKKFKDGRTIKEEHEEEI